MDRIICSDEKFDNKQAKKPLDKIFDQQKRATTSPKLDRSNFAHRMQQLWRDDQRTPFLATAQSSTVSSSTVASWDGSEWHDRDYETKNPFSQATVTSQTDLSSKCADASDIASPSGFQPSDFKRPTGILQ